MRSDDLYLHEIVVAATTVEHHVVRGGPAWADDSTIRDAVLYRLTVIGEAAGKVSDEIRGRDTDIP